jgi:hypothetical protein
MEEEWDLEGEEDLEAIGEIFYEDFLCHPAIARVFSLTFKDDADFIECKAPTASTSMFTGPDCLFPLPVKGYPILLLDIVEDFASDATCSMHSPKQVGLVRSLIHRISSLVPACRSIGIAAAFAGDRNQLVAGCERFWGEFGYSNFAQDIRVIDVFPMSGALACSYDVLIVVTGNSNACGDRIAAEAVEKGQESTLCIFYKEMISAFQRGTKLLVLLGGMDYLTQRESSDSAIAQFICYAGPHTPVMNAENFLDAISVINTRNRPRYVAEAMDVFVKTGDPHEKTLIADCELNRRFGWDALRFSF